MLRFCAVFGALSLFSLFPPSASAEVFVWYDAPRQAIAIDTYALGYGHQVEVDFNSDHLTAGLIVQRAWAEAWGNVTDFYVYEIRPNPTYDTQRYGYAGLLGDFAPAYDFTARATALWDGEPTLDGFSFFAPVWDVSAGRTVVYARPVGPEGALPVTEDVLTNTFLRFDEGSWFAFAEVPEVFAPVEVNLNVSPGVVEANNSAPWITARIELPEPYTVDDVELDSVVLTMIESSRASGVALERVNVKTKVARDGDERTRLVGKFDRTQVVSVFPQGEYTVYVNGRLRNGRLIRGSSAQR